LAKRRPRRPHDRRRPLPADSRSPGSAKSPRPSRPPRRSAHAVLVQQRDEGWELLHPRCAIERADDIEEVRAMINAGEFEIARDELRWLLGGCHDFVEAHRLLGELALLDDDYPLARGHFGYAWQIGIRALKQAGDPAPAPYGLPGNRPFLEAGKGLIHCLRQLDRRDKAAEVVQTMLHLDPADPLNVAPLLSP
jgi:hypothetical protein